MQKMRSELSQIASRLEKACKLPPEEQIKWSEKIQELKIRANTLAVRILIGANREIAMETAERKYGGRFTKFLNENDYVSKKFDEAMSNVDKAYASEEWSKFVRAVNGYKDMVVEVDKLFMQNQATGFRETIEGEVPQQNVFD